MMPVLCDFCYDQPNGISVHLEFTLSNDTCKECHHVEQKQNVYCFCDRVCMIAWYNKYDVSNKGFPCKDCTNFECKEPTGYAFGFKENGPCAVCNGNKSVK